MANYLTVNYFTYGELLVQNISGSSAPEIANANNVKYFIAAYEPEFLEKLLGEDLYVAFSAGMAVLVPEPKWTALRDKIFQADAVAGTYISPAANYVYYHIVAKRHRMAAAMVDNNSMSNSASPIYVDDKLDLALVWASMYKMCTVIWEWIEENIETYTDFDPYQEDPFAWFNSIGI